MNDFYFIHDFSNPLNTSDNYYTYIISSALKAVELPYQDLTEKTVFFQDLRAQRKALRDFRKNATTWTEWNATGELLEVLAMSGLRAVWTKTV